MCSELAIRYDHMCVSWLAGRRTVSLRICLFGCRQPLDMADEERLSLGFEVGDPIAARVASCPLGRCRVRWIQSFAQVCEQVIFRSCEKVRSVSVDQLVQPVGAGD
jgi:hypothetical protein